MPGLSFVDWLKNMGPNIAGTIRAMSSSPKASKFLQLLYRADAIFLHDIYPGGWRGYAMDWVLKEQRGTYLIFLNCFAPQDYMEDAIEKGTS